MSDKLFKDRIDLKDFDQYVKFIEDGTQPIGFGEKGDEVFERTKAYLFLSLYHLVKDNGPSFDTEIYFTSIISDLNETFDNVGPSLLQLQREKNTKPELPENFVELTQEQLAENDEFYTKDTDE